MEAPRLQVLHVLGKGAFGVVWHAELLGEEGFRKEVAVKVLHRGVEDEGIAQRLRDEARILGLIRHPGVVHVDGLAKVWGCWAVVMELIEGADLSQLLTHGPLPARVALEITGEVARVLATAWETRGPDGQPLRLVHRDIKPSNVRLTPAGSVKVLDFGLARAEFHGRESESSEESFGTPLYMSPERLEWVDGPEGDVYALGAMLFEMLVGEPLGRTHVRPDRHAALLAQAVERLRSCMSKPDHGLEGLLLSMLAFEPSKRPTSRELDERCEALADVIGGEKLRRWAAAAVPAFEGRLHKDSPDEWFDVDFDASGSTTSLTRPGDSERTQDPVASAPDAAPPSEERPRRRTRLVGTLAALLLGLLTLALALLPRGEPSRPEPEIPLAQLVPVSQNDPENNPARNFALSPDGRELIYATLYGTWRVRRDSDLADAERLVTPGGHLSQGGYYRSDGSLLLKVSDELWLEEGQEFRKVGDMPTRFLEVLPDNRHIWWQGDSMYLGTVDQIGELIHRPVAPMTIKEVQASPDGSSLAIEEQTTETVRLSLLGVDGGQLRPVVTDEHLGAFAWLDPDRLVYVKGAEPSRLYVMDLKTEQARAICDLPRAGDLGTWNLRWDASSKKLYLLQGERAGQHLWTGSLSETGTLEEVRPLTLGDATDHAPLWLDDRTFLFASDRGGRDALYSQEIDGLAATLYAEDPDAALYSAVVGPGGLFAWREASDATEAALVRVRAPRGPHEEIRRGAGPPALGSLACAAARAACACFTYAGDRLQLGWLDSGGDCVGQVPGPLLNGALRQAALSPDGSRLLLMDSEGLWSYEIASGLQRPVEAGLSYRMSGAWASDGRSAFVSGFSNNFAGVILQVFPEGGAPVHLYQSPGMHYDLAESPDGSRLLWRTLPMDSRVMRLDGVELE